MDPLAAELALAETVAARRRTERLARAAMAVPLRVLVVAWVVLCPLALLVGRDHLGPWVGIALLVVTYIAWRRYKRVERAQGIGARLWPWLTVALVAGLGGAACSHAGTVNDLPWLNVAGPFVLNALALAALAWLVRSRALALVTGVMVVVSLVAGGSLHGDLAVAIQFAAYAMLLLTASTMMAL